MCNDCGHKRFVRWRVCVRVGVQPTEFRKFVQVAARMLVRVAATLAMEAARRAHVCYVDLDLCFASRNRNRRQPEQQPQHAQQPLYSHIAIHIHCRCRPAEVCAEEATTQAQRYVAQLRKPRH